MRFRRPIACTLAAFALLPSLAAAQAPATQAAAPPPAAPVTGFLDGFFIQTPNGDYRLVFGFVGQEDGRFFINENNPTLIDTFLVRKFRPTLTGRIGRYFDFKFMPDLGSGQTIVADAYFDIRFSPKFRIRAGKDKTPIGYELLQGDAFVLFPERSLASGLVPNRDNGFQVQGDVLGNHLFYSLGVFNGIPDGTSSSTEVDTNDPKDVAARFVVQPWRTAVTPLPRLSGLGFALGGSVGIQAGPLPVFKTSAQQTYYSYATGATADGQRHRITPAVFYYYKELGAFAEYMNSTQWVAKPGVRREISNNGWETTVSWLVTGETASDRYVRPKNNFDPVEGHWGAFQVLGRYMQLTVDREAFTAGLAAVGASREAQAFTLATNWYPNPYIKIYGTYERTVFDHDSDGPRKAENVILFRTQVGF